MLRPAGGEPLLHPLIHPLIAAVKAADVVTNMVTNASLLDAAGLLRLAGSLDWLAVSVDASTDGLHAAVGRGLRRDVPRGSSGHLAHVKEVWALARELVAFRLKLNKSCEAEAGGQHDAPGPESAARAVEGVPGWSLACSIYQCCAASFVWGNPEVLHLTTEGCQSPYPARAARQNESHCPFPLRCCPACRITPGQVRPIEGQNDAAVEGMLVSEEEFSGWVVRHEAAVQAHGSRIQLVTEGNAAMQGSYAMLDTTCRCEPRQHWRQLAGRKGACLRGAHKSHGRAEIDCCD